VIGFAIYTRVTKKTPAGELTPKASRKQPYSNPVFFTPTAPAHGYTSPFLGDFAFSLDESSQT